MSRELTSGMQTAVAAATLRPVIAVYLDLPSGAIRVNSTPYTVVYAGENWLGIGSFGSIGNVQETPDFGGMNLDLSVSGLDATLIGPAFTDHYQGRAVSVYFGLLDDAGALVADPTELFTGRIDYMTWDGDNNAITVRCENELVDWERPRIRRYNNEDQQSAYPGDVAFEYVEQMVNAEIKWGY